MKAPNENAEPGIWQGTESIQADPVAIPHYQGDSRRGLRDIQPASDTKKKVDDLEMVRAKFPVTNEKIAYKIFALPEQNQILM